LLSFAGQAAVAGRTNGDHPVVVPGFRRQDEVSDVGRTGIEQNRFPGHGIGEGRLQVPAVGDRHGHGGRIAHDDHPDHDRQRRNDSHGSPT
jgi:hypothetical protein